MHTISPPHRNYKITQPLIISQNTDQHFTQLMQMRTENFSYWSMVKDWHCMQHETRIYASLNQVLYLYQIVYSETKHTQRTLTISGQNKLSETCFTLFLEPPSIISILISHVLHQIKCTSYDDKQFINHVLHFDHKNQIIWIFCKAQENYIMLYWMKYRMNPNINICNLFWTTSSPNMGIFTSHCH